MKSAQLALVLSLGCLLLSESPLAAQPGSLAPEVGYPLEYKVSSPVRNMPPQARLKGPAREIPMHRPPAKPRAGSITDPVLQTSTPSPAAAQSLQQWEGLGAGYPGFTITAVPPDTNMAVGPNHIVQWVNGGLVIFNKQGVQVNPPVSDGDFWGVLSTCNQLGGFSDPIVQYDRAADRWLVGEVALPLLPPLIGQFAQCFAVSTSSDPAGAYNMWAYGFGTDLNDYPKIAVWPDGYYVTWNMWQSAATFIGARACSFDRSAMLGGAAAPVRVCFQLTNTYGFLLPSDLDGATPPPAGSPNFLMNVDTGAGALNLWKFHVNYKATNLSTFTGPVPIANVAPFNAPCQTTQDCISQPGTNQKLDAIGDGLMYRLAYRNFGDHESLVANHTVTAVGGNTAVRWYEVRNPNGTPSVYQQGSFAPDSDNRWMASIAMDQSGDIGVGYSVASSTIYPSIRYTGWEVDNPLGTLQAETSMVPGSGSQTGYNRWGDYSAMRIDPSDDCTFWYTTEYQAITATANWNTRVGSFKFPSCGGTLSAKDTTTTITSDLPDPSAVYEPYTVNFSVTAKAGSGTPSGNVTVSDGSGASCSATVSAGSCSLTSTTSGNKMLMATYAGDSNFNGSSDTEPHTVGSDSSGVPAAPSNLTATAIFSGSGKNKIFQHVTVGWSDNSNNETNFLIQRCTVEGKGANKTCKYSDLVTLGQDVTSYNDSNAGSGNTYMYRLAAMNDAELSAWSNEAQVNVR